MLSNIGPKVDKRHNDAATKVNSAALTVSGDAFNASPSVLSCLARLHLIT